MFGDVELFSCLGVRCGHLERDLEKYKTMTLIDCDDYGDMENEQASIGWKFIIFCVVLVNFRGD